MQTCPANMTCFHKSFCQWLSKHSIHILTICVVPLSLSLAELFASIGFALSCSIFVIFTKDCVHINIACLQLILLMRCRGIKWEELEIWPQLQAARVLLLQQGIEQGQPAAVQLMLQIDPSLVRQCPRYVMHASGPTLQHAAHAVVCASCHTL